MITAEQKATLDNFFKELDEIKETFKSFEKCDFENDKDEREVYVNENDE